jgi:GLPGLI family protein
MKHLLLLASIYLNFFNYCFGQETAIGQVNYHFIHMRDTTQRDKPYYEDFMMLVGKSTSVYKSVDNSIFDQKQTDEVQRQIQRAADPNHVNFTVSEFRPVSTTEYYQFLGTGKLFIKQALVNNYLVENQLPAINWTITGDTSTLGGYRCQKAITHYKGRDYAAWFCADLPFHNGPWELNGLPGLILQASDSRKEVIFNFESFTDIRTAKKNIDIPQNVIKISKKDFARLQDLEKNDPTAFYNIPANRNPNVSLFGGIDHSKINSIHVKRAPELFSKEINNPIERAEK